MKICFVSTIGLTLKTFFLPIANELMKMGNEVSFVSNFQNCAMPNTSVALYNFNFKRGFSFFDFLIQPLKLRKFFKKKHFDAVVYTTPNASYYCCSALRKKQTRKIYFQIGLRFEGYSKKTIRFRIMLFIEKYICKHSDSIRTISRGMINVLKENRIITDASKVSLISNGGIPGVSEKIFYKINQFNTRDLKNNLFGNNNPVVSFVGRICKDKGIEDLIDALSNDILQKKINILLVGDYDKTDPLSNKSLDFIKQNNNVFVTGFVEKNKINEYLNVSDVFVLASKREGFGVSVAEAMLTKTPVIVSNIHGLSEIVVNMKTGLIVEKDNPTAVKEAVHKILSNNNLRNEIIENAFIHAKNVFTEETVLKEIVDVILDNKIIV